MSSVRDPNSTSAERPVSRRHPDEISAPAPTPETGGGVIDGVDVNGVVAADTVVAESNDTAETEVRTPHGQLRKAARVSASRSKRPSGGARVSNSPDVLPPGMRVGQYVIDEAHSRGGFATVYKATHQRIGREVALKVLHATLAGTPNIVKRFEQEARAVNKIRHPNIVDITDYGELSDGRPFFAMEWLHGATLKQLIYQRGALSQEDALRICEDIVPALAAAHEHGIIHRDLKLSNVIGVPKGDWFHFKLLDFGIAKVIHPDGLTEGLLTTMTGNRVGSPLTMAPEQIRCQPVDQRTDIYALGVMLFELVTGKPPFRGSTPMEVEKLHLRAPIPNASEFAPVNPSVAAVIERCMQKAQDDRYGAVNQVLVDLRKAVADGPGEDPTNRVPLPQPTELITRGSRKALWLALLGGIIIGIVVALALAFGRGKRGAENAPTSANAPDTQPAAANTPGKAAPNPMVEGHSGDVTQLVGPFNPEKFDVNGFIARARGIARTYHSDAVLIRIDADNVRPDGTANLTVGKTAIVMYQFRSPSRSVKQQDPAMTGGRTPYCLYYVYSDKNRVYHYPVSGFDCAAPLLDTPRCSTAEIWVKARKHPLPAKLGAAKLRYTGSRDAADSRRGYWIFSAGTGVELKLADDCDK